MKIAHIVPHSVTFPLRDHNGRYDWVLSLAKIQSETGHEVTIYCNPESVVPFAATRGIVTKNIDSYQNNIDTFALAFRGNHDVFHSHFDDLHYEVAAGTDKPILFTQHWWPTDNLHRLAQNNLAKNIWAVPPTSYMYEYDKKLGVQTQGFIYHGIDLNLFKPAQVAKNNRLLFVGRISPEKNLEMALTIAKNTGRGLDIVGKVAKKNMKYWHSLQPLIDDTSIRYLNQKTPNELVALYASALGVLCPYDITESFGLVSIEAQACGTPVIMKRGGSRGELLVENLTGFLCDAESEYIDAVSRLSSIKPQDCVAFAQKFDIQIMASQYQQLYETLISDLVR